MLPMDDIVNPHIIRRGEKAGIAARIYWKMIKRKIFALFAE
jgi:hypothetical protein